MKKGGEQVLVQVGGEKAKSPTPRGLLCILTADKEKLTMNRKMNKTVYAITAAALFAFMATAAFAAPAAKFTANVPSIKLINPAVTSASTKILRSFIKTPNQKDLLIGVSLETGLYTQTKVAGKNGDYTSASATAGIGITVLIDGVAVNPGTITFDERSQTLNAVLGGVIQSCTFSVDPTTGQGTIDVATNCIVTNEMIELILDTMAAHHFNFVAKNLPAGSHTIEVLATINANSSSGAAMPVCSPTTGLNNCYDAKAMIGHGSLTIEEVRATNNPDGVSFDFAY
jgi:hypothetical protein